MDVVLPLLTLLVGLLAGGAAALWLTRAAWTSREVPQAAAVREGLDRLHERMRDLEQQKAHWEGQLHQQVEEMRHSTESLRRETSALGTALRRPQVRGQWGELQLKRTVELAGMREHCDFSQQVHHSGEDGILRPDLVVHLTGGRSIVVDAKVPLTGHLDALATDDVDEQRHHLERHARQVRAHVDALGSKAYWRAQEQSPEFVVMFVPLESSLPTALDADPGLLEYAAGRKVFLATPTTLIALLRTVAHGWNTEVLAERTREIHALGRQLHERLATLAGHVDRLGRSLDASVEAYNRAVGSLESRVLVSARQFAEHAVTDEHLASPRTLSATTRPLTAPELLDAVAESREELPDLHERGAARLPGSDRSAS